jgi:peptidoglycan/LPS O-acetylase OafA/YrhL
MIKASASPSDSSTLSAAWSSEGVDLRKTTPAIKPTSSHSYLPALDGLRGIAILLVLIYHCSELVELRDSSNALDWLGWRVFQLGWVGVDLFFVLSGFLITGILQKAKSRPKYFSTFYARRSLRIFPLYYLLVFFTFLVFPHIAAFISANSASAAATLSELPSLEGKIGWYLAYASNFLAAMDGNMGHRLLAVTWSLAIEEQFYFIWPLVVYHFRERTVFTISLVTVVAAFAIRCGLVWALREGYWDGNRTAIYVLPFCRMDSLAIGAVIAILWQNQDNIPKLKCWSKWCLLAGPPLFFLAIIFDRFGSRDPINQTFGYSFLGIFFGAALIQALLLPQQGRIFKFLTFPAVLNFGKLAYGIYMFHVPMMYGMDAVWFGKLLDFRIAGSSLPMLVLFIALLSLAVFIAAKISWILIERPFLRLKRFFPSSSDEVSRQRES